MDLDPGDSTAGAAAGAAPAGRLGSLGLDPGDSTAGAATHRWPAGPVHAQPLTPTFPTVHGLYRKSDSDFHAFSRSQMYLRDNNH